MTTDTLERAEVPQSHRGLLEQTIIAHLATVRPDGGVQNNPVWFEWDGEMIKISQTKGRQKMRNVEDNPQVALTLLDPDDDYRYLELRGLVERVTDDDDNQFIDSLSERYIEQRPYPGHQPGDERVIVWIRPTDSSSMG